MSKKLGILINVESFTKRQTCLKFINMIIISLMERGLGKEREREELGEGEGMESAHHSVMKLAVITKHQT